MTSKKKSNYIEIKEFERERVLQCMRPGDRQKLVPLTKKTYQAIPRMIRGTPGYGSPAGNKKVLTTTLTYLEAEYIKDLKFIQRLKRNC